jgi:tRNA uracil 4-sulfurtransferase
MNDDQGRMILVRYGEIGLKGQNRGSFERSLVRNIRRALEDLRPEVTRTSGRILVEVDGDQETAMDRLRKVLGIVSVSPVVRTSLDDERIAAATLEVARGRQHGAECAPFTFKIDARRSNKSFHRTSPEINRWLGAHVLRNLDGASVDVHNPDLRIQVEIRRENAFVTGRVIPGCGGLPVGTSGRAIVLLSGGIDSPVAAWYMMKRGLKLEAIHFHTPPFTGPRAQKKVEELASLLAPYNDGITLHLCRFTDVQNQITASCPERLILTIMRRSMLRIAAALAEGRNISALVTGESLGQVASQTLENMIAIDAASPILVLRPLLGMDKDEIVDRARDIGTYETSILPHEDCCSIFVPRHPKTRPSVAEVEAAESGLSDAETSAIEMTTLQFSQRGRLL